MTQPLPDPSDRADSTPHGDPLLDAAQERGDRDDGSRHGADATGVSDPDR